MQTSYKTNSAFNKASSHLCFEFSIFDKKESKVEEIVRKFNLMIAKFTKH